MDEIGMLILFLMLWPFMRFGMWGALFFIVPILGAGVYAGTFI